MAGFFGRGFFGGMGGAGMDEEETKEVDNKKLYELLEVDPKASEQQIRSSYKKLVLKHHPDRGGDPDKIKEINLAYEILSDREKRELYDRYGLDGVRNNGGGGGGGFEDLFDIIGGGGRRKNRGNREKPKMKSTVKEIEVTLEDIYNGKLIEIPHKKTVLCGDCSGTGGKGCKKCTSCDGQGAVIKTMQIGPGMYQRAQVACSDCQGKGEMIDPANMCKGCRAKKVTTQEKKVQVSVEAGTPSDHVIKINGEGDEHPDAQPGDLLVKVNVKKHPLFQRQGADLFLDKTISLKEALLGFNFELPFLDGKKIKISSNPGEVINPGDIKTVKDKGLPFYRDMMYHGNLIIKFKIDFPEIKGLPADSKDILQKVLPGGQTGPADKSTKPEYLLEFHESDANTNPSGGRGGEEDDDEDPRGGGRQECVVQ